MGLAEPAVAAAKAAVAAEEDDLKDTRRGVRGWALLVDIRIERVDIGRLLHNTHTGPPEGTTRGHQGPPGRERRAKKTRQYCSILKQKHNMAPDFHLSVI